MSAFSRPAGIVASSFSATAHTFARVSSCSSRVNATAGGW